MILFASVLIVVCAVEALIMIGITSVSGAQFMGFQHFARLDGQFSNFYRSVILYSKD